MSESPKRAIPSVEKALHALGPMDLPRPVTVDAIRRELAKIRDEAGIPGAPEIMERLRLAIAALRKLRLQPVINATGIPLHTNLGRAPLAVSAIEAIVATAGSYNNLEYDLENGGRGSRGEYIEMCLALLCEAEAATVVNNCAAALVLLISHFTKEKREVVISRGELIQIGGGFRIPEILERSGAKLREVGTTNRTTLEDYAGALGDETGLILKVHRSNFHMEGFVKSPETKELAKLAVQAAVTLVEDLGSGAVFDTAQFAGLMHEITPAESLRSGVNVVCFSGDKLFGGPQAGIIAGKVDLVRGLKQDPLFRALRCDKLVFAALQATTEQHLSLGNSGIPTLAMLAGDRKALRIRAESIVTALAGLPLFANVNEVEAEVGGGSLPRSRIPSIALSLSPCELPTDGFAEKLRTGSPPIIGYIAESRLLLDLRTVFPSQDLQLVSAIKTAVESA